MWKETGERLSFFAGQLWKSGKLQRARNLLESAGEFKKGARHQVNTQEWKAFMFTSKGREGDLCEELRLSL